MCECLEYEEGDMYLCEVCGTEHKRLTEEREQLRNALKPFADVAHLFDGRSDEYPVWYRASIDAPMVTLTVKAFRDAKAVLTEPEWEEPTLPEEASRE